MTATLATGRSLGAARTAAGVVVAAATGVLCAAFALGAVNPWEFVVLKQHFANYWAGIAVVSVGAYVALWLLAPLRNEAVQRGGLRLRVTLAIIAVFSGLIGGMLHEMYHYQPQELDRTADGERTVAVVTVGGTHERQLQVWQGSGLFAREIASVGRPCGGATARFAAPDLLIVDQGAFGDPWSIPLSETGEPLRVLAPHCADPPVPATLEP